MPFLSEPLLFASLAFVQVCPNAFRFLTVVSLSAHVSPGSHWAGHGIRSHLCHCYRDEAVQTRVNSIFSIQVAG